MEGINNSKKRKKIDNKIKRNRKPDIMKKQIIHSKKIMNITLGRKQILVNLTF